MSSVGRSPATPVLLVHGFASSFERNWREPGWVDILGDAGHEVIGGDLPGHGSAAKPHDPAAYDRLEDAIVAQLPAGPVDAVGFSMGAGLLLTAAAGCPGRFRRIVVGGVGAGLLRAPDPGWGERLAAAVERGEAADGDPPHAAALAHFARGADNDPAALAACLRRRATPITPELLAAVTGPVLVVCGERDFAGPPEPLAAALPDGRAKVLRNVDHFATPRDFGFIDATVRFLDPG